jgi:hypothetical protein
MESFTFRDITLCSPVYVNGCFAETCSLQLQFRRISEARNQPEVLASKASVGFRWTTRLYIPDVTLHKYCCEILNPTHYVLYLYHPSGYVIA